MLDPTRMLFSGIGIRNFVDEVIADATPWQLGGPFGARTRASFRAFQPVASPSRSRASPRITSLILGRHLSELWLTESRCRRDTLRRDDVLLPDL